MCTKNNVYCTQVINQYYYCKNNLKAQFTSLSVWSLVSQSYWEIFTKEQFKIKQLWKLLRKTGFLRIYAYVHRQTVFLLQKHSSIHKFALLLKEQTVWVGAYVRWFLCQLFCFSIQARFTVYRCIRFYEEMLFLRA